MRRYLWVVTVLMLGWSGSVMFAQKVSTPEGLDKVMKGAGRATAALGKAIAAGQYADVKTQLPLLRQAVRDSQNFWAEKHKDDGVKFANDVLAKIDVLEKAVAADAPDKAMVSSAYGAMSGACLNCHRVYRATDEENNFVIKPGTLVN
jgi:cytochrome c556